MSMKGPIKSALRNMCVKIHAAQVKDIPLFMYDVQADSLTAMRAALSGFYLEASGHIDATDEPDLAKTMELLRIPGVAAARAIGQTEAIDREIVARVEAWVDQSIGSLTPDPMLLEEEEGEK